MDIQIMVKKRIACFLMLQTLLALLITLPQSTASTSSYYLDASRLEIMVSPTSHTASGMVKVSSNSSSPVRLKVIPKLWQLTPQGIVTYINPPSQGYNLLDNMNINPEEFELLPGKSRLVRFLVKVPADMKDVEYPFQLYFQPTVLLQPEMKKSAAGVSNMIDMIPVFTTTVYVYQGSPTPDAQIKSFQCAYQSDKNQFSIDLNLENKGNKHARLFGNALILKKDGLQNKPSGAPLEVFHLQNSMLIVIFPGNPRIVQEQLTSSKKFESGHYQMELQLVDERSVQPAIRSTCDFTVGNPK